MATSKIQTTKNYRLFERHAAENRPLNLKNRRKLRESMQKYGFLKCFPIVVVKVGDKHIVKDGQHRAAVAEELGLAIHWMEEPVDFDVALVNSTAKTWQLRDYAEKHAANNLKDYQEAIDFSREHHVPIGTAFAMLAGTTNISNCQDAFMDGSWKVKDRKWAGAVAGIYGPLILLSHVMKNARCLEACMAVCRVKVFEANRLLANAERCREKLVAYSTKEAYLDMLESVYNFGRNKLVGLKAEAVMAMRSRIAAPTPKQKIAAYKREGAAAATTNGAAH